jgi:hypothetical protein
MIIQESKLVRKDSPAHSEHTNYEYVDGYFLTINDLAKLVLDFEVDYNSKDIVNTKSYIEEWLKNHVQIVKKD